MKEIWKNVVGYDGYYEVSNLCNVRSVNRIIKQLHKGNYVERKLKGKKIKPNINKRNGYVYYYFTRNGKGKNIRGHILVANAFIPNPKNFPQINHIDGNKQNNCVDNLEWCTCSYNVKEAYRIGLANHYQRKVNQYDKNGNFIKCWESATVAGRKLNICSQNIVKCCKKRIKYIGGFEWSYDNPELLKRVKDYSKR